MRLLQIGSFQTGAAWESEDPLSEVWSRVELLGSREHIKKSFRPEKASARVAEQIVNYSAVRVRQAVEFREAARVTSPLTAPLTLYYSFLNLLRGFYSLRAEEIAEKRHGLSFHRSDNIFECAAKFAKGTFTGYLDFEKVAWSKNTVITLKESLQRVVELHDDYRAVFREPSLVAPITIRAFTDGEVLLDLSAARGIDVRNEWELAFPHLSGVCTLASEGPVLRLSAMLPEYEKVAAVIQKILEPDLRPRMSPRWFSIRRVPGDIQLPRAAHYFIALFILGSIVRYEPEFVSEIGNREFESAWLVRRLLRSAERYFPQLMMIWLGGDEMVYF